MSISITGLQADLHEDATRPFVNAEDVYLIDDQGDIAAALQNDLDWSAARPNVVPGWASRSAKGVLYNWVNQQSGTGENLRGVYFIDQDTGWNVGFNGTILHTTDGGSTWNSQQSGTGEDLYGVYFIDQDTAWIVGDNGTILHTTDGAIQVGGDRARRIAIIKANHDGTSYQTDIRNDSQDARSLSFQLMRATDGFGGANFYLLGLFVDIDGKPHEVEIDAANRIGFGIEYEQTSNGIQAARFVLVNPFTYPASPDDSATINVTEVINLNGIEIATPGNFSLFQLYRISEQYKNMEVPPEDEQPSRYKRPKFELSAIVNENLETLTTAQSDIVTAIMNERFTPAIYGSGGSGTNFNSGAISRFDVQVVQ